MYFRIIYKDKEVLFQENEPLRRSGRSAMYLRDSATQTEYVEGEWAAIARYQELVTNDQYGFVKMYSAKWTLRLPLVDAP